MKNINEAVVVAERVYDKKTRTFSVRFAARRTQTNEVGKAGLVPLCRVSAEDGSSHGDEYLFDTFEKAFRVATDYNIGLNQDDCGWTSARWNVNECCWDVIEGPRNSPGRTNEREYYVE